MPSDTKQIVSRYLDHTVNLGLVLNKYINCWAVDDKGLPVGLGSDDKKAFFSRAVEMFNGQRSLLELFLNAYRTRWESMAQSLGAKPFPAKVEWRMAVGLGSASVLEAGLTVHPVYGFPIIPGSSLKGVAKAYATSSTTDNDADFLKVFGYQRRIEKGKQKDDDTKRSLPEELAKHTGARGKVVFFDAIPASFPKLEVDIINVHYKDYYEGNKPPADWLSPSPNYFLTVGASEFLFAVACPTDDGLRQKAEEWLKGGLMTLGAGAKTMVGYGYFQLKE